MERAPLFNSAIEQLRQSSTEQTLSAFVDDNCTNATYIPVPQEHQNVRTVKAIMQSVIRIPEILMSHLIKSSNSLSFSLILIVSQLDYFLSQALNPSLIIELIIAWTEKQYWEKFLVFDFIFEIYLFLAVLGLCCCAGFSLAVMSRSYSLVAVRRLLIAVASLAVDHAL